MSINRKEQIIIIAKCMGLLIAISYLFYNSVVAAILISPVFYFFYRSEVKKVRQQKRELAEERFKDILLSVLAALKAGYSIENAFKEAERDLTYRFGESDEMVLELSMINRQIKNSISIESLITDLANRLQSDDIKDFAGVFRIARKSGGDLGKILERTISVITGRMELKQEIALLVAAKKYEQQIMNMVPMGIIFYIRLTNPGYFDGMYHNFFGVTIMTLALGVYGFSYYLAEKILNIA